MAWHDIEWRGIHTNAFGQYSIQVALPAGVAFLVNHYVLVLVNVLHVDRHGARPHVALRPHHSVGKSHLKRHSASNQVHQRSANITDTHLRRSIARGKITECHIQAFGQTHSRCVGSSAGRLTMGDAAAMSQPFL